MNDKLDLQSTDITAMNIDKIAVLFPNCVTETAEGKKIDFDLLKQELSTEIVEGNKERYRLEWPGKREAIVTANIPTTKTLRPVREDSVDFDTTENIYIEGDNLEVLKLLQESYLNKIKMIYIDPPYNTGNDFVYKDNFAKSGGEELFESGQIDEENRKLSPNPKTDGRYHSDWLSNIYPVLKLSRNLLKDDGVIFISIDDNEVHNLRKICDEIFGESNFIGCITWKHTQQSKNDERFLSRQSNYNLVYSKNILITKNFKFNRTEEDNKNYSNPDDDPKGFWRSGDVRSPNLRQTLKFQIIAPNGNIINPPDNGWRWSEEVLKNKIQSKEIIFKNDNSGIIRKIYLSEQEGRTPENLWDGNVFGTTRIANSELKELFGDNVPFDTPKPTGLIQKMAELFRTENDFTVVDFYSGSATTAHAVMKLNAEDDGNRKYIMVQLPEASDEKTEAYKAGYKNICEIGKERIRRASNKIKEEKIDKAKKDGLFSEFKDEQDYGFRVYRLDSSNMQDVYYKPQDYNQGTLDLFADNVKEGRTAEDLLTQIMLDWGLPLSLPIERKTISGKEVYSVAGDSLYCCFDDGIDEAFAKEIAKEKPLRIVFRDKGFKDDTAKENVKQLLKQLSAGSEMKVL
ncbi:site-specific DNA-methyltransferase [Epilithonimonas zeae]|uniref:site-specific DNA-methyltransferase (adenine-specific) n=1 Tax=Epilithonimonas zeae TaxID=1416779 RepID=A0A1N6GNP8_9FLAO|nr:site-specific DNA-methyltransferase [Epilithonimonas zeae]SIO09150.1 adenine-specific DNA-methyltransferase [Epilithonimonas zeae]